MFMLVTLLAAAQEPRDAGERADDARDKVICKRFVDTGSLVRGSRICKTKAEWERDRDRLRENGSGGGACFNAAQAGRAC